MADPRIVKDASKLEVVSYDEMLELASLVPGYCSCGQLNSPCNTSQSSGEIEFSLEAGTLVMEAGKMRVTEL